MPKIGAFSSMWVGFIMGDLNKVRRTQPCSGNASTHYLPSKPPASNALSTMICFSDLKVKRKVNSFGFIYFVLLILTFGHWLFNLELVIIG